MLLIGAFVKTLRQLPDPTFRRVLLLSVALTFALFVALTALVGYLVQLIDFFEADWLDSLLQLAGFGAALVTLFLFFPAAATMLMGFFLDDVAEAVERRFYPADPPGRSAPLGTSLLVAMKFSSIVIALNLLALPVYAALFWFPPLNLFVFYGLNGYLLSREYFELVTLRHLDRNRVQILRKAYSGKLLGAGVIIAFMMTIPLLNLVAPIFATAFMVNVYKGLERRRMD